MRVVVIGASGHVGTYLVPRLVAAGHQVVAVSRGQRQPYQAHRAWAVVEQPCLDRRLLAGRNAAGTFGLRRRYCPHRPRGLHRSRRPATGRRDRHDLPFSLVPAPQHLVEALLGHVQHPALRHDLGSRAQRAPPPYSVVPHTARPQWTQLPRRALRRVRASPEGVRDHGRPGVAHSARRHRRPRSFPATALHPARPSSSGRAGGLIDPAGHPSARP